MLEETAFLLLPFFNGILCLLFYPAVAMAELARWHRAIVLGNGMTTPTLDPTPASHRIGVLVVHASVYRVTQDPYNVRPTSKMPVLMSWVMRDP